MTAHVDFVLKTLHLLQNRPRHQTLNDVAKKADVSLSWLEKFACGAIADPGARRLQRVYEFLANKPLLNTDASVTDADDKRR